MKVYYSNAFNTLGLHTIVRTWGGNLGIVRPSDLVSPVLENTSVLEIDFVTNREVCKNLTHGYIPKPVLNPNMPAETPLIRYYVTEHGQLCYEDGNIVPINTDSDKDLVDAYPQAVTTYMSAKSAKTTLMLEGKLEEIEEVPEVTVAELQEQLDELKDIVRAIITRNNLAEWKQ